MATVVGEGASTGRGRRQGAGGYKYFHRGGADTLLARTCNKSSANQDIEGTQTRHADMRTPRYIHAAPPTP